MTPGIVKIRVGSQDYPGSAIRWKAPVDFDAAVDRKIDVLTTGELHCIKISSEDSNTIWNISGLDLEYVMAGAR